MTLLIYFSIGALVYIALSVRNVIRNIKEGMTKNEAIEKELSEGYRTEIIMLILTMLTWPLMLIFLLKNVMIEYFAEKKSRSK